MVITSNQGSNWMSCKIITPNLLKAYQSAFGEDHRLFHLVPRMTQFEIIVLGEKIFKVRPDRLVFIDHIPHPIQLIKILKLMYGAIPLPPIYFHVYGDFGLYASEWVELNKILRSTRVHFLCASERQVSFVSQFFLKKSKKVIELCPFPVNPEVFYPSSEQRQYWREKLGLAKDQVIVVYSGRISLQKNVPMLIRFLDGYARHFNKKVKLLLAGDFDDVGAHLFGIRHQRGFYYQNWQSWLDRLNLCEGFQIEQLGLLTAPDLRGVYNAADIFSSLSLHHDEDFGMAPAEALACGTPTLLSDWGGYASFDSSFISVKLGRKGVKMNFAEFKQKFSRIEQKLSTLNRREISQAALNRFSIDAASIIIRRMHASKPPQFGGFNKKMTKLSQVMNHFIPFPNCPKKGGFYEEIYQSYYKK